MLIINVNLKEDNLAIQFDMIKQAVLSNSEKREGRMWQIVGALSSWLVEEKGKEGEPRTEQDGKAKMGRLHKGMQQKAK